MRQKIYQIDAFASEVFKGNPAAVCPLEEWLDDALMQNIAMENNLAETAFVVKTGDEYQIRWFTPQVEVDLCGHATLATAYVLFNLEGHTGDHIEFYSPRSGKLSVSKNHDLLTLNFPVDDWAQVILSAELNTCFNKQPHAAFKGKTDYMLVFNSEADIRDLAPDLPAIAKLGGRGVIATAKGEQVDFVSRFFAPQAGIDEDPVTGSAHTTLTPYWSQQLGKDALTAIQRSERTGYLQCRMLGDRVEIAGNCKLYMEGHIHI